VRWFEGGPLLGPLKIDGEWDEVVERATAFITDLGDATNYQAPASYMSRAEVRAARGDDTGAAEDAAKALKLARPAGDPQLTGAILFDVSFIYMTIGDPGRAEGLFDESLEFIRGLGDLGWLVVELPALAWVARKLGRSDELLVSAENEALQTPWLLAARAIAAGDDIRAAEIFGEMGHVSLEAYARLQSGREPEVRQALEFYRRVGATRYIREGEALLAASA
jgi:tetratricopeptide (TPR) repeat protein